MRCFMVFLFQVVSSTYCELDLYSCTCSTHKLYKHVSVQLQNNVLGKHRDLLSVMNSYEQFLTLLLDLYTLVGLFTHLTVKVSR